MANKRKQLSDATLSKSKRQRVKEEESRVASSIDTKKEQSKVYNKKEMKKFTSVKVKVEKVKEEPEITITTDSEDSDVEELKPGEKKISEFERKRQENLKANAEFFAQLGILQAKQSLQNAVAEPKPIKLWRKKSPPGERRVSLRLKRIDPEGVPLPPLPELVPEEPKGRRPPGPLPMAEHLSKEGTEDLHLLLSSTFDAYRKVKVEVPAESKPLDGFLKSVSGLGMTENTVAKVVQSRIYSLAVHPTTDKVLVVAGDRDGNIGFWDVLGKDRQDGTVMYSPHVSPVTCLRFPPHNAQKLFSSSYDGTLRCADFTTGVFDEIYSLPEEDDILLRYFDFLSAHTLLVARQDGYVALVDTRTKGTEAVQEFQMHKKSIRTINIHPLQKDFFVTCSTDKTACVWDLRHTKTTSNKPVAVMQHTKSVDSAFFSSLTGCHIVTSSSDDYIRIFDVKPSCASVETRRSIRHNNYTGRYLTNFRPTWHPLRDDLFVSGSMQKPRQIELFSAEGTMVKTYKSDFLNSVCSINEFHPTKKVLVGGNSSGRVHVFM